MTRTFRAFLLALTYCIVAALGPSMPRMVPGRGS